MTAADLGAHISRFQYGATLDLGGGGLVATVRVTDAKESYGQLRFLVQNADGYGKQAWVSEARLRGLNARPGCGM